MSAIAATLGQFAAGVRFEALPRETVDSIQHRVLDIAGLCLAAHPLETSPMAVNLARSWGGEPECSVIGSPLRLPANSAAFVNGVLAHSLDFDDTHLPSVLHPSACVVPAALAAAESAGASGRDLIAAAAAGYEICIRTGMAAYDRKLGNSVFFEKGWHATSICGTLAAAATAAKLYGLTAEGISHALGIAASFGAGVIEGNRSGGSVKRLHCGWAAHAGLIAAQSARAGFTGPVSAFEGRFGFYRAFCDGILHEEEIRGGLGEQWNIAGIFYKPYPANHFTHAGIDAALRLKGRIAVEDIASIRLAVSTPVLRTIAEPREAKIRPQSGYQAQFSGPFTIAAALLGTGGGLGVWLDDFRDDVAADPRYRDLAAKVECVASPECDAIFPNQFPAILTVRMKDGAAWEERVMANRGGSGNPLSSGEIHAKFFANAARVWPRQKAERLAAWIAGLPEASVREAGPLLAATS